MAKETKLRVAFTGVDKTGAAVKSIQGRVMGMTAKIGGAIAGGLLVRGLARFGAESVRLAQEQEAAEKKLASVLRATEGAAGRTFAQLKRISGEMQSMTNFGDEVIMNGMAILATFKNIGGEQFEQATAAALDLAAALDTDVKSAAIQLGKALNDPAVGLTYLNRAGITFSATQQKMIRGLAKQGKLTKAQSIILAEVESQFGGVAAGMADPLKQIANLWGDVREGIGLTIMEFLEFSGAFGPVKDGLFGLSKNMDGISLSIFSMVQGLWTFVKVALVQVDIVADAFGRLTVALDTLDFKSAFEGFEGVGDRVDRFFKKQDQAIEKFAKKKSDSDIAKQLAKVADKAEDATDKILRLKGLMGKMTLASSYAAKQMQFGGVAPVLNPIDRKSVV